MNPPQRGETEMKIKFQIRHTSVGSFAAEAIFPDNFIARIGTYDTRDEAIAAIQDLRG
jgi:hypothetical protein